MNKYYYYVAQLPFLKFGDSLPIKEDYFLEEAKKWLTDKDLKALNNADIDRFMQVNKSDPQILRDYKGYEYSIRKELSLFRQARKQNKEYRPKGKINEILAGSNPLMIERELLRLRWGFLEEEEIKYYFDLNYVTGYFLKMQVIKRHNVFEREKGKKRFQELSAPKL